MTKQGDLVADTLEYYRSRVNQGNIGVPIEFQKIRDNLIKVKKEGKRVLVDIKESYNVQTTVLTLQYVGDRWAMGYSKCYTKYEEVNVPYTIHYSDIHANQTELKFIVEGENPFKNTEKKGK